MTGRRIALAIAIVLIVVLGVQTVRKGTRPQGFDLGSYLGAAKATRQAENPYVIEDLPFPYLYPPFFAWAMIPFELMPYEVALVLWYLLSVIALAYSIATMRAWVIRGPPGELSTRDLVAFAVIGVVFFRVVHANFTNGQINLLLVAMCVGFLDALRRGKSKTAALCLALAVHTKLVPAVLFGYLLLRRAWGVMGWSLLFCILMALLPITCYGADLLDIYLEYKRQIAQKLAISTVDGGAMTVSAKGDLEYFTLRGFIATVVPTTSPSVAVKYASIAAVIGAIGLADVHLRRAKSRIGDAVAFSLYLLGALLISPVSEKHHLALAIPAVSIAVLSWRERRPDRVEVPLLGVIVACMGLSKPFPAGPFFFLELVAAFALAWYAGARAKAEALG